MHFQSKFSPAARKLDRQIGLISPEISIVFDWLSALCYVSKSWFNDCDKDPMTHRWVQAFEFAGTKRFERVKFVRNWNWKRNSLRRNYTWIISHSRTVVKMASLSNDDAVKLITKRVITSYTCSLWSNIVVIGTRKHSQFVGYQQKVPGMSVVQEHLVYRWKFLVFGNPHIKNRPPPGEGGCLVSFRDLSKCFTFFSGLKPYGPISRITKTK